MPCPCPTHFITHPKSHEPTARIVAPVTSLLRVHAGHQAASGSTEEGAHYLQWTREAPTEDGPLRMTQKNQSLEVTLEKKHSGNQEEIV